MKALMCRLLIALMIWTPYQVATAGMIGTDQVVQSSAQMDRSTVLGFVSRADVASQLQAYGLDAATAKDRVAAMTDQELRYLAGQIESQPAGANNTGAVLLIIIIIVIVWWAWKR
jgi:uncharacterized membrane protein